MLFCEQQRGYQSRYKLLSAEETEHTAGLDIADSKKTDRRDAAYPTMLGCVCLLISFILLSIGYVAGKSQLLSSVTSSVPMFLRPSGTIRKTFEYNRTFTKGVGSDTEAAWLDLFPRGRGFFHNKVVLGDDIAGFTVFHQLHCLSGLRQGYYDVLNQQSHDTPYDDPSNTDAAVDKLNMHIDAHHMRHCFDYLRQTIMCAADTNFEILSPSYHNNSIRGSTGWGVKRLCRDFDKIVQWSERWRLTNEFFDKGG